VPRHIIGLDLGQTRDFTALAVLEKSPLFDPKGYLVRDPDGRLLDVYDCVHLGRYPLGTPYPAIVADVAALARRSELKPARGDSLALAIDQTGVGGAVVDLFRREKMPAEVVGVMIASGSGSRWDEAGKKAVVSKIELVGQVQSFLQTGRLKIVSSLKFASLLKTELLNFQVKVTPSANEVFGTWREGQHDDLVLAVAMAAWLGEHHVAQTVVATSRRFPTPASRYRPTQPRHWAARCIEQKIRFYR
jgi:hypothetical protein